MKRHAAALFTVAVLSLVGGSCARDEVTGIAGFSADQTARMAPLENVILFSTEEFGTPQLAVVNPDGSGRRRLTNDDHSYGFAAVSPDRRRIAFTRFGNDGFEGLYLMNADGSGQTLLVRRSLEFDGQAAWSPDGSQIAFQSFDPGPFGSLGKIFVINVDGTGLRQLSPPIDEQREWAIDEGPTWSPDGTRIAFTRNSQLHIINADGSGFTPVFTDDGAFHPAWSPDGTRIAYQSMNPWGDIHVRNTDGSNLVVVTANGAQEGSPRWSPDSRRLVFERVSPDFRFELFVINTDGTGELKLTPDGLIDHSPFWASSATQVAGVQITIAPSSATLAPAETQPFTATVRAQGGDVIEHAPVQWSSSNEAVATVTASGLVTGVSAGTAQIEVTFAGRTARAAVTVTEPPTLRGVILYVTSLFGPTDLAVVNPDGSGRRLLTTDGRGYGPEISPDGRQILFARLGAIYVMKADATDLRQIFSGRLPSAPVWSPDGSRIAVGDNVPGPFGDAGRIFVMNADGSGVRQLSPDVPDPNQFYYSDYGPTWSPDGSKIAFSRFGELTVINVDGTGMVTLPTPDGAEYPSWSPDGTRLAFTSWKTTRDVFVSNADGSDPVRVTAAPEQENNPRWSPDSRRLVFCRVVNGYFQLYIINADGTDETRLSANPNAWECPAVWSPVP